MKGTNLFLSTILQELLGLLDVAGVVDVEHLRERIGPQAQSVADEGPLEVAHAALASLHAGIQRREGAVGQPIDASADEVRMVASVEEGRNKSLTPTLS